MPKPVPYTFEVATNAPVGVWKVADRVFWDRRLTLKEKTQAMLGTSDAEFLTVALSALKVEGEDVAAEWVEEHLSEQDAILAATFILGGAAAVQKALGGT
jgi:hypothetical protein